MKFGLDRFQCICRVQNDYRSDSLRLDESPCSNQSCLSISGADPRGAHPAHAPPKIGKKYDFSHEIPQKFSRLPLLGTILLSVPPPNLKSWIHPCICYISRRFQIFISWNFLSQLKTDDVDTLNYTYISSMYSQELLWLWTRLEGQIEYVDFFLPDVTHTRFSRADTWFMTVQ